MITEKEVLSLLDAIGDVSASENNESCPEGITTISYAAFEQLLNFLRRRWLDR